MSRRAPKPNYEDFEEEKAPEFEDGDSDLIPAERRNKNLVLIDCDAGLDDAWAMFVILRAQRSIEVPTIIEAITCVNGNTNVDNVAINVTRCMDVGNDLVAPIYRGAAEPLIVSKAFHEDPPYFGKDGFGDSDFPPTVARVQPGIDGVKALIKHLTAARGLISVLAIGPLTNLALAVKLSPKIKSYPKHIIILGGTICASGNVTPTAEFNFAVDPEAARIVLESFTCPITVVPWETCDHKATSTYDFRINTLGKLGSPEITFMNRAEAKFLQIHKDNWMAADALTAAILIEPKVITKSEKQYYTVELCGEFTRAQGVVDRIGKLKKKPNVRIVTDINLKLYQKILVWSMGGPFYK